MPMGVSLIDRLTQAIRVAEQSMQHAQYQGDFRNWHEVHRVLQDARDELNKPTAYAPASEATVHAAVAQATLVQKLDGRTKAARALKAQ